MTTQVPSARLKQLFRHLVPGEQVLASLVGRYYGPKSSLAATALMALTDSRLLVHKKGLVSESLQSYALDGLAVTEFKSGWVFSNISLRTSDGPVRLEQISAGDLSAFVRAIETRARQYVDKQGGANTGAHTEAAASGAAHQPSGMPTAAGATDPAAQGKNVAAGCGCLIAVFLAIGMLRLCGGGSDDDKVAQRAAPPPRHVEEAAPAAPPTTPSGPSRDQRLEAQLRLCAVLDKVFLSQGLSVDCLPSNGRSLFLDFTDLPESQRKPQAYRAFADVKRDVNTRELFRSAHVEELYFKYGSSLMQRHFKLEF